MLKGKTTSILLIIVVSGIWIVLIYKFVSDFSDPSIPPQNGSEAIFKMPKAQTKERFELLPINRDPFFGARQKKSQKNPSRTVKKEKLVWPQVIFQGIVASAKGKDKVFIVQINGQQYLLSAGEEFMEVKLVRGSTQKIQLIYKGQSKEFILE